MRSRWFALLPLLLALAGCKPKFAHEIGKVEADSLMEWKDLAKLGTAGAPSLLGKTVTFKELYYIGTQDIDPQNSNSCTLNFMPVMGAFQEKLRTPEIQRVSVVVYANYEQAKGRIGMNADTLLPEFGVNSVKIDAPLCTKCQPSYYDGGNKNLYDGKYYGGSTVEECLLQSRETLHITGKVVGLDFSPYNGAREMRFFVIPTGIGW